MEAERRSNIIAQLQREILQRQGFSAVHNPALDIALGPMTEAFPGGRFPTSAVHEFLSARVEDAAASSGFIVGLLAAILGAQGTAVWISAARKLFPPAIAGFGLDPERFIFLDPNKEKDVVWAMNEALRCGTLKAVIGEMREIGFTESRRMQLAVEKSHVTGFILRHNKRNPNITACVSRWKITSLPSASPEELPGIGFPSWNVELLRMRNGKTGSWRMQWKDGAFVPFGHAPFVSQDQQRKAG